MSRAALVMMHILVYPVDLRMTVASIPICHSSTSSLPHVQQTLSRQPINHKLSIEKYPFLKFWGCLGALKTTLIS